MDTSSTHESSLLLQAQQGDKLAFGKLVQIHQTAVFNVAYRVLGNRQTAEDAAQEAFLRAYRALDRFDRQRQFAPWIKRISVNVCLNWLEAERIRPQISAADLGTSTETAVRPEQWAARQPTPEQTMIQAEISQQLRAAIIQLPPQYRAVIELRHFQELSYAEMAETLERPVSSVKSDLFRARKLLATSMKP